MEKNKSLDDLLSALTEGLSDEELLLAAIQSDIAAEISTARIAKGLSQQELADTLGVSQALVSRWENGDVNFTLQTLVRIALKLDIKMKSPYIPVCHPKYFTNGKTINVDFAAEHLYKTSSSIVSPDPVWSVKADLELKEM